MVTPLGASAGLRGLNSQLSSLGAKVKAAGPSLFSTSSPMAPAPPTAFDRGYDSFNPSGQQSVAGTRDPFGGDIFSGDLRPGGTSARDLANSMRGPSGLTSPMIPNGPRGPVGSLGPGLDQWDEMFQRAAAETGMDPAMLKAIASVESGGVADAVSVAGAIGIMQVMPMWGEQWGLNLYDPYQNILAGAKVLREKFNAFGSMEGAVRGYLGIGEDALGTSDSEYLQRVMAAYGQITGGGAFGSGGFDVGNPAGNSIVNIAQQYLGVSYVWGGIPGKGADPWASGWDCSGFTYWLDQNYGTGTLPMGSHYQYQNAVNTGQLFTDLSQLQPGDLVYIDTGWYGGAGGDMNAAGHVGMYIGNGKMIHAANPEQGTIISDLAAYGGILGAQHMSWSGGGMTGGFGGFGGGWGGNYQSGSSGGIGSSIFDFLERLR